MRIGDDLEVEFVDHSDEITQLVTFEEVRARVESQRAERVQAKAKLHTIKQAIPKPPIHVDSVLTAYQPPSYRWASLAVVVGILAGVLFLGWIGASPMIAVGW